MKLLIDMNLSPRWADFLRNQALQADHWSTIGDASAPDSVILDYALQNRYIVLTHDLDFSAILASTGANCPSVIQIRSTDLSPAAIGAKVVAASMQMEKELEAGALLTIDPGKTRLRVLPLMRPGE
jgi:predicted nuclease of predicted toxin-antitoxin system